MITNDAVLVIPSAFEHLMGVPDEGTRIYRAEGNQAQMRRWFDALWHHIGPCLSPGGVALYAKVSRAAVYKRMKAGSLTTFCFRVTGETRTLFGNQKKLKELPLVYIPVEECKAWAVDLDRRAVRLTTNRGATEDESVRDSRA